MVQTIRLRNNDNEKLHFYHLHHMTLNLLKLKKQLLHCFEITKRNASRNYKTPTPKECMQVQYLIETRIEPGLA